MVSDSGAGVRLLGNGLRVVKCHSEPATSAKGASEGVDELNSNVCHGLTKTTIEGVGRILRVN